MVHVLRMRYGRRRSNPTQYRTMRSKRNWIRIIHTEYITKKTMGWLYSLVAAGGRSWVDRKWQKSSCRKINFAKQQKKRQQPQRQIVVGLVDLWPTYPETFDSGVCAPSPHGHESERYLCSSYIIRHGHNGFTEYGQMLFSQMKCTKILCFCARLRDYRKPFNFTWGFAPFSFSTFFFFFLFFSYLFGFSLFCVGQQNRVNFLI